MCMYISLYDNAENKDMHMRSNRVSSNYKKKKPTQFSNFVSTLFTGCYMFLDLFSIIIE